MAEEKKKKEKELRKINFKINAKEKNQCARSIFLRTGISKG